MDTVRWGLLSTANINRRLIPAIQASQRGQLLAVASRKQSTAEAYAAQWEIPHAFGSYQAMLDSDQIDAVYIGLPNHLHTEWSIRAMQAGKHVLCEKPFALTLADVDAMIEASQKYQRVLAEAFMYRHHPQTKIVGEWVQNGRIGEPIVVKSVFNYKLSDRTDVRLKPEYGGGCLWDVGVYPMSFAQYIFNGPPIAVEGLQWIGGSGVDETFVGQMLYPGGGLAQISSSFRSPFHIHAEVIGTEGRIALTRPFIGMEDGRQMCFFALDGEPVEIPIPEVELYSGEVNDMHAAILDNAPTYLTLAETRNHILTILALYEAANKNQQIPL
jgi:D-xylose 1-dehydrogenase (NADP+, D-xylono-1,5-lactone-forming)